MNHDSPTGRLLFTVKISASLSSIPAPYYTSHWMECSLWLWCCFVMTSLLHLYCFTGEGSSYSWKVWWQESIKGKRTKFNAFFTCTKIKIPPKCEPSHYPPFIKHSMIIYIYFLQDRTLTSHILISLRLCIKMFLLSSVWCMTCKSGSICAFIHAQWVLLLTIK